MSEYRWTTEDEIDFLDNIGTFCVAGDGRRIAVPLGRRVALLWGYRAACDQRAVWGEIDAQRVSEHADDLIVALQRAEARAEQRAIAGGQEPASRLFGGRTPPPTLDDIERRI